MTSTPAVVVKKGGVLTTLVSGIFGTLIVLILCGAGLGFYSLHIADRTMRDLLGPENKLIEALPRLGQAVPMLGDLFSDRRAPDYRSQLEIAVRLEKPTPARRRTARLELSEQTGPDQPHRELDPRNANWAVVEVTNRGDQTVTLLTARIVVLDATGAPAGESRCFLAAPLTLPDDQWRGPLLPGSTRRLSVPVVSSTEAVSAELEITDLRIWVQNRPGAARQSPSTQAAQE